MQNIPPRRLLILSLLIAASLFVLAFRFYKHDRPATGEALQPPSVILWAWERPEDLRFIDSRKIGVAYLAKTISLSGAQVLSKPRLQPLSVSKETMVVPVVRIEVDKQAPPALSDEQALAASAEISKLASGDSIKTIQIDFDATASQRQFYRTLLKALRKRLPAITKLSITALGSWCQGDNWLDDLPIDEAVPMLFRMGVDRNAILSQLASNGLKSRRCQTTAGISTDEAPENLPTVSRLYVFNPSAWNRDSFEKMMEKYHR